MSSLDRVNATNSATTNGGTSLLSSWIQAAVFTALIGVAGTANAKNVCDFSDLSWFNKVWSWPLTDLTDGSLKEWIKLKGAEHLKDRRVRSTHQNKIWRKIQQGDFFDIQNKTLCVSDDVDKYEQDFLQSSDMYDLIYFSKTYNVDYRWILSVIRQESGFKYWAKSPTWAWGLMQLTWIAIEEVDRIFGIYKSNAKTNTTTNLEYGIAYFAIMLDRFKTYERAVQKYNADWQEQYHYKNKVARNYKTFYQSM